jgi:hypothetical protein
LWQFAIGVDDTGVKFATGTNNNSGTCAKFVAGVVDTVGKLLPVLLIPVVNLVLQVSLRIFSEI